LNAAAGEAVEVSEPTRALLELAVHARTEMRGWFEPFMAHRLIELGYDRTIDDVRVASPPTMGTAVPEHEETIGEPLRTPAPLQFDGDGRVALGEGVAFDPGGIAKGHTADLVAEELMEAGARGALVNIGGDLRVVGDPESDAWSIDIANPFDDASEPIGQIGLTEGGLATSSPLRRRWQAPDGTAAHHMLDPRTGRPARIDVASLTVTAPDAATAEALATAVMLAGPYRSKDMLADYEARAFAVLIDGPV
jgi:thiamine biosynthesis lipoprotein